MKYKKTEWIFLEFETDKEFWLKLCDAVYNWWLPSVVYIGCTQWINRTDNKDLYKRYGTKFINNLIKCNKLIIIHKDVCKKTLTNYYKKKKITLTDEEKREKKRAYQNEYRSTRLEYYREYQRERRKKEKEQ